MTRKIDTKNACLIADAVNDAAQKAIYWKSRAQIAEDGLSIIRGMLQPYAGKQSIEGDVFKIADASLPDAGTDSA